MLGSSALLVAAMVAAAGSTCPIPEPNGSGYDQLAALEQQLEASLRSADAGCRPALNLALGTTRVRMGYRAADAVRPLTQVIVDAPDLRGRALLQLGLGQALAGDPFEALRALAAAQRLLAPTGPDFETALDVATLVARLRVRRGGSAWGSHQFDLSFPLYRDRRLNSPKALAASPAGVLVLCDKELLRIGFDADELVTPLQSSPHALAVMADGRPIVLAKGGVVRFADGSSRQLEGPIGPLDARAIAVAVDDRLYAVEGDGQLNACPPLAAGACQQLPTTHPLRAIAADGRGGLHVLHRGSPTAAVLDANGVTVRILQPLGPTWEWRKLEAIAADRFGGTYLLSAEQGVIYLFDPSGAYSGRLDPPDGDTKRLQAARSLAVTADGAVYVLTGRNVVRYR